MKVGCDLGSVALLSEEPDSQVAEWLALVDDQLAILIDDGTSNASALIIDEVELGVGLGGDGKQAKEEKKNAEDLHICY